MQSKKERKKQMGFTLEKRLQKRWFAMMATIVMATSSCTKQNNINQEVAPSDTIAIEEPTKIYGLAVDSFTIESYKVGRNDNLTIILMRSGLSRQNAYDATMAIGEVFDVRNLRQGNNYTLFFSTPNDSTRKLSHFVYDVNQTTYLRCDIKHPMRAIIEHREVKSIEKSEFFHIMILV